MTLTKEFLKRGMERAIFASASSHDPDTQTGCAFYDSDGVFITAASNRVPFLITVTKERTTRPEKYSWIEHCERNAIYNHGSGHQFFASTVFLNWFPCADCARALVAVNINRLVYKVKADRWADPRYGFDVSKAILEAGGVQLVDYDKEVGSE